LVQFQFQFTNEWKIYELDFSVARFQDLAQAAYWPLQTGRHLFRAHLLHLFYLLIPLNALDPEASQDQMDKEISD